MMLDKNKTVALLWTLSVLFYLLRTIAEPIKYLFLISFGILIIIYAYLLLRDYRNNRIVQFLLATKEFLILGLLVIMGIVLSSHIEALSLKSLINFIGITAIFLIYHEYKDYIQLNRLLRSWIFLTLIIGIIGLFKWLNLILELHIGWFSIFYEFGSSLVSEYNFYACYFLISILIFLYALHKRIIQNRTVTNQIILFVFLLNVVLSGSRRGLILLALLLLLAIFLLAVNRKKYRGELYKNLRYLNIIICVLVVIFIALIPFRSSIVQEISTKSKIARSVYRYSTILIPNITYSVLYYKLWPKSTAYENDKTEWPKYATYNNLVNNNIENIYIDLKDEYWHNFSGNENFDKLIYNGNFEHGQIFWEKHAPDSIVHEIVSTKFGTALRVSRFSGEGYWPLEYVGRKLIYYKGVTYTFRFKYRVIKGSGVPFKIGWWINEGDGYKNNLIGDIKKLDKEWFEFTASYKFKNNQYHPQTFMNSQQANSIVDFADIELSSDDLLQRPKYLDQLGQVEGPNLFYNSNFENGLIFWESEAPDSINHELIETIYGKAIRVSRKEGQGYWPLSYQGRNIYYHKNLTYSFRFKFRVVKGGETPFNIGWWVNDEEQKQFNIRKVIFPLNDEWSECIASYKFKKDFYGRIPSFMNSQESNSIIDFADIELLCDDTLNRFMYTNENVEYINNLEHARLNQLMASEQNKLFTGRIIRWKYAKDLWSTEYNWSNKLFGKGFDYLEMFGEKFYPDEDRIDYPHNPIISAFLYSGLIGGFFYIYFLALSFWYYWKYRKHHMLFSILFLITFVFVFISSDSHFNVPIFAMLSLVPFITRSITIEKAKGIS